MICPVCACPLSDGAALCPNCGVPFASPPGTSPYDPRPASSAGQVAKTTGAVRGKGAWQAAKATAPTRGGKPRQAQAPKATRVRKAPSASSPRRQPAQAASRPSSPVKQARKNHVVAGVLALAFGSLGVHKFYLGYIGEGFIMLFVTVATLGAGAFVMEMIGIIEGIIYLTRSDRDFYLTYEVNKKGWL